jgi:Pvc16 N-terminal domain
MFTDVDETLRQVLLADVPVDTSEIDISFERPTREWSSRLSRPTINLFLCDIRERTAVRDQTPMITRGENGTVTTKKRARRIDLNYVVTAWTREAEDEHRILARVLSCMFRQSEVDEDQLQGSLVDADYPLMVRVEPPDHYLKPVDLWGVLDNELHASHTWVATAPLDAFAPIEGAIVRSSELRFGHLDGGETESFLRIGGVVHEEGSEDAPLAGVTVKIDGTGFEMKTGEDGRFAFASVLEGDYEWVLELPDGTAVKRPFTVHGASYDIGV